MDINQGLQDETLKKAAKDLGLEGQTDQVVTTFKQVYECFLKNDCNLIEINPLVLTEDGTVMAADSKITIDDNAAFR